MLGTAMIVAGLARPDCKLQCCSIAAEEGEVPLAWILDLQQKMWAAAAEPDLNVRI